MLKGSRDEFTPNSVRKIPIILLRKTKNISFYGRFFYLSFAMIYCFQCFQVSKTRLNIRYVDKTYLLNTPKRCGCYCRRGSGWHSTL